MEALGTIIDLLLRRVEARRAFAENPLANMPRGERLNGTAGEPQPCNRASSKTALAQTISDRSASDFGNSPASSAGKTAAEDARNGAANPTDDGL